MAIRESAQRNHDELFPNHVSTLKGTDPELIELFDNWAFDEVLKDAVLDTRTRLMVQLAAMIACQAVSEYRVMLGAALQVGVTPVEAKEIVYQAVPYVGMAKVFDFLHATNEVLRCRGVELPLPGQSTTNANIRAEKGLAIQKQIFGDRIDQMYAQAPQDELHIHKHLSASCFGDYYTRTGLDVKTRELLTFSMLAALGGCEAQLQGHVAGNLAVGNDRRVLLDTITQLLPARVAILEGDVLDLPILTAAMKGQNVVYANLAGAMKDQADSIVLAMHATSVKRLIFISSMGIYGEVPGERYTSVLDPYRDSAAVIETSDLDYTILRPGWFTRDTAIDYRITQKGEPFQGHDVSLNSVSDLIVKLAMNPTLEICRSLGVNNG